MNNIKNDSVNEFDLYADNYHLLHEQNINLSGESPDYFSAYKIKDMSLQLKKLDMSNKIIVDFGCGIGNSIKHIKQYFPDSKHIFLDISSKSIEIAKSRYPGIDNQFHLITNGRINLPDKSVDVIFTACVFHHIDHLDHTHWLKELNRIVKPGGYLFIFEHNPYNPLTLHAVNTCPFDENAKLITARKLKGSILNAGWLKTSVNYRIFFPKFLSKLRFFEKYMVKIPFGAQYFIMASK